MSTARRSRKNIRNNVDLASNGKVVLVTETTTFSNVVVELEVEDTPALRRSSASSGVDRAILSSDFSRSPVQGLLASRASGSEAAVQTEVTLGGADGVGGPHNDLLGTSARDGNDRSRSSAGSSLNHAPVQVTRTTQVRANHLNEAVDRVKSVSQGEGQVEGVTSSGQNAQVLLTAEVLEEEVDRVGLEELVLRRGDDVGRLGSEDVVEDDGVNELDHGSEFRLVHVAHDVFAPLIFTG